MSIARAVTLGALLLTLALAAWPVTGQVTPSSFMFMDELEVGMEGIGKTTVRGNEMQEFNVEIVGIVDNPGDTNDYIMVRSHGDAIEAAGGYAQGMSGSPIYIDDKLIGAFYGAFAFNTSSDPVGYVRPIETMLPLAEAVADQASEDAAQRTDPPEMFDPQAPTHPALASTLRDAMGDGIQEIQFAPSLPSLAERQAHPEVAYVVPMSSSVWVGGLSGRALEGLKSGVSSEVVTGSSGRLDLGRASTEQLRQALTVGVEERFGKRVLPMASAQASDADMTFAEFEPGRPMSALLAQGDVSFGSICTTSYVDPAANVLLACGHQIYMTGKSSMLLGKARVIETVNSAEISFVLPQVSRQEIHGTVRQDRTQAIGASLGDEPRTIDFHAQVTDQATGNERTFDVRMADSGNLLGSLIYSSLLQAVDSTINRIGQGTMTMRYAIDGENLPKTLERTDVFASQSDVAVPGPTQVAQAVLLLDQNEFDDPAISNIDVEIEVDEDIQQFRLVEVETDQETYQPSETISYTATLRAFRGERQTVSGEIELPDDVSPRQVTLRIAGGAEQQQQQSGSSGSETPEFADLEELVQAVEASETNDQITVQLLGLPQPQTDGDAADRQTDSTSFGDVQRLGSGVVTGEERQSLQIDRAGSNGDERDESEEESGSDGDDETPVDDEDESSDEDGCSSYYYC